MTAVISAHQGAAVRAAEELGLTAWGQQMVGEETQVAVQ